CLRRPPRWRGRERPPPGARYRARVGARRAGLRRAATGPHAGPAAAPRRRHGGRRDPPRAATDPARRGHRPLESSRYTGPWRLLSAPNLDLLRSCRDARVLAEIRTRNAAGPGTWTRAARRRRSTSGGALMKKRVV